MNNYINFPKNYKYSPNMANNSMLQPKMNQNNMDNIYEPYEGFIKGTMFSSLYNPYKIERPFEIQPMNEQAQMLTNIDALTFATIDLNLYLDVNPNDQNAINLFNQYRSQKEQITKNYENKFGPLALGSDALSTYPWAWDNQPWPWEN